MYSSCSTDVFSFTSTRSIASVGTSAIITRRRAFAIEQSTFVSMNVMRSSARWSTSTPGSAPGGVSSGIGGGW
jgi:hypothetical protein